MLETRAPSKDRAIDVKRRYVDHRHWLVILIHEVRNRESLSLAYATMIGLLLIFPVLWPAISLLLVFLLVNNRISFKKLQTLPLKLPRWLNKTDYHELAVANRYAYQKAQGSIHMGNELGTQLELWIVPNDQLTHMLFISTTGGGKTEFLWSYAAASSFMSGGALIYVDAKAAPDGLEKLFFLGRKTGREDSIRIMNYRTGNKEVKQAHWQRVSNTCGMFAIGTASIVQQFLEDMMPPGEGENQVFRDKAVAGLKAFLPAVVELRDQKLVNITPTLIGQWFSIPMLCKLAYPEHCEHVIPLLNEQTGEITDIPIKISTAKKRALRRYLESGLPGFNSENVDMLKNGNKQPQEVHRQFGFGLGYVAKPLIELGSSYAHIFECEQGEIDFRDIILNNRVLGVFVPASEQSNDQKQVQGKIALSGIRVAISTGLGDKSEGDIDDVINNLPIDKKNPSQIIIDEYAEVAIDGFAVAATQGRGLGIGVTFSGQDLAGFIKASKEEATQIFGNTRLKILGPQEDVKETWDWFKDLAGTMSVAESSGWEESKGTSLYRQNFSAQIKEVDRLNWLDVKEQTTGEGIIFQNANIVKAQLFNIKMDTSRLRNFRINRLLEVLPPSQKEIESLLQEVEIAKSLKYMIDRAKFPSTTNHVDLGDVEIGNGTDWIYALIGHENNYSKRNSELNQKLKSLTSNTDTESEAKEPSIRESCSNHDTFQGDPFNGDAVESVAIRKPKAETSDISTEALNKAENEFIYEFDTDLNIDAIEALKQNMSQMTQKMGVDKNVAEKLSELSAEKVKEELKYTQEPIATDPGDIDLLWGEIDKLSKKR
ncbi:TraM recognition domain-containing protein [Salinimonas sp. HHU 13199]|uniref:TraM recognition domain-containing protein n=1 Tax=Salinimonas profundi TaxID=2729140 RepID=A0ABR8LN30_9ALTE|nr:TraM recognition domain-containing protein [Salinimonas profundi]MBD3587596.1 TraM recognition domain-containing protein [Salinimonas profundi]